ncbi:hypothetical protein Tco_0790894 [Tanacetum coccineum]
MISSIGIRARLPGLKTVPLCLIRLITVHGQVVCCCTLKLLVDSVLNRPFQYGTIVEPGNETTPAMIRARTYTDLIVEEKIRESVDINATNIVLQGLPQDIYNLVNHNEYAKQIWDIVKLLIQGSKLSLQERESKLYNDFDTFTSMPGDTIQSYYMRFAQLINDMHTIGIDVLSLYGLKVGWIRRIQELDTAYWGFLGVGTMLDIFQNIILIPYHEYGVLSPLDTAY